MNDPIRPPSEQLWLELPPISARAPRRLLVFLHGAGSRPEVFAPVAVSWQLKFPGATASILQGLQPSPLHHGLDVTLREDQSRMRTPKAARVLGTIRRVVVSLANAAVKRTRQKTPKTMANTGRFYRRALARTGLSPTWPC